MISSDPCPIEAGRWVTRPGRYFKRMVVSVGEHRWTQENGYCMVPVQFRNGDYAILRWNMLDGNPFTSWDQTDEIVEIRSGMDWVNKEIRTSRSMPKIIGCRPNWLAVETTSESHTWEVIFSKALGGNDDDSAKQTDSDIAHAA
jgi:hypothetical protein